MKYNIGESYWTIRHSIEHEEYPDDNIPCIPYQVLVMDDTIACTYTINNFQVNINKDTNATIFLENTELYSSYEEAYRAYAFLIRTQQPY